MSLYNQLVRQVVNPLFVPISASSSGDNTVVAAVPGFRIRIVAYNLMAAAEVTCTWKSATAGAISGPKPCAARGGIEAGYQPIGRTQTAIGEALVLNLSDAVSVGGELTYVLI